MQARPETPAPEQPNSTDLIDTAGSDDHDQSYLHSQHQSTPPTSNPRFPTLGLAPLSTEYTYGGRSYLTGSPDLPSTPPSSTTLTALPMSDIPEGMASGAPWSIRSGSHSSNLTSVPRSMRYNPIVPSVAHSAGRGRKGRLTKQEDSTDNDSDTSLARNRAAPRALDVSGRRRPHIGPEQRRRNGLRASYHRLKNAVPSHSLSLASHERPSKIALLDQATTRIDCLEKSRQQLLAKIREVEEEAARLRQANEGMASSAVGQPPAPAPAPL